MRIQIEVSPREIVAAQIRAVIDDLGVGWNVWNDLEAAGKLIDRYDDLWGLKQRGEISDEVFVSGLRGMVDQ